MAMNPMGGIDQQIQQRKMQFKDNPQQLQQRYGQNKELLDLLALQEISKEQQQRSQRMQMEAQQNPATVADQMQQEVLQGKKAEMAQGLQGIKGLRERTKDVGGALAQKQQQQQQRMQQQGQQPQRPPQQQQRPQGQPMMAAAGGLMTQAAPNIDPRYFEGGGIVAFKAGGPTAEEIEEYVRLNPAVSREEATEYLTKRKLGSSARETVETYRDEKLRKFKDAMAARRAQDEPEVEEIVPTTSAEELERQALADAAGAEQIAMARETIGADAVDAAPALPTGAGPAGPAGPADAAAGAETGLAGVLKGLDNLQTKPNDTTALPVVPEVVPEVAPEVAPTTSAEELERQALADAAGAEQITMAREAAGYTPPEKQLTPQQQYLKLLQAQEEAINKKEEGLKDTRSNTRRLLDRLTDAAINASKRPAATTSRGALASFGTGISESVRAEKAERKEGLADIAKRRGELVDRQLAGQLGLAQISQGQQGLDIRGRAADTAEATLAESTRRFDETLASTEGRFDRQLAASEQQWKGSNALAVLEAQGKIIGQQATLDLKEAELDALTAFQNAKTNIGDQDLQIKAQKAMGDYEADVLKLQQEALTALGLDSRYTGDANKALRDKQAEIIKLQFAGLIANKRKDLSSILGGGSGAVDFSSLR